MLAMKNLGYTVLYAQGMVEAAQTYRMVPDLVKMVIVNDWEAFECWKDTSRCRKTAQNPTGIPAYKVSLSLPPFRSSPAPRYSPFTSGYLLSSIHFRPILNSI